MISPTTRALIAAFFVLIGWLMTKIGVGALLLGGYQIYLGNPWALLLLLPATAGLLLGVSAARSATALLKA
jgi:hypothetical protein